MRATRKWMMGAALLGLLLAGVAACSGPTLVARARLGAAYGARVGCACRYVEGRAMGSCADDKEPGMAMVRLEDVAEEKAVRASVPLLASRTARFKPGWGCLLDPAG